MKKPKLTPWKKGAPPSEGWWNASRWRDRTERRFWDGRLWSASSYVGCSDVTAAYYGSILALDQDGIEWRGLAEPPKGKK